MLHSDFLLVADKWGALFIAELRLLIVVASLAVEHRLQAHGLHGCGTQAYSPHSTWDLPGSELEPMSPVLAGGFLTTRPLGKPSFRVFDGGDKL